jgi:hypothetical protein
MKNDKWDIVVYAVIVGLILIAPMICIYSKLPWFAIIGSFVPLIIFVLMRIVGFMNEIESGLLCIILSILISLLFPAIKMVIDRKEKESKVNESSASYMKLPNKAPNKSECRFVFQVSLQSRIRRNDGLAKPIRGLPAQFLTFRLRSGSISH